MKARALVLMLGIMMISITGFGNTTADLTDNSTPEIVQMDVSENVVIDWEQFKLDVRKASAEAVLETNAILNLQENTIPDLIFPTDERPYLFSCNCNRIDLTENVQYIQYSNKDPARLNIFN